jgi:hypothetical protein
MRTSAGIVSSELKRSTERTSPLLKALKARKERDKRQQKKFVVNVDPAVLSER